MIEPGLVNHEDPSSYNRCPAGTESEGATMKFGNQEPLSWPQLPTCRVAGAGGLASSQGPHNCSHDLSLGTLGSPGDDTPSQEPPRPLIQEGGSSPEVKPDLMGLVGSVRVIFCSSGICSHLKCRLQSNPTGKAA